VAAARMLGKPMADFASTTRRGDARALVWMCAGDAVAAAKLAGLSDGDRAGGQADLDVVAR
jgi:hypothetical protein